MIHTHSVDRNGCYQLESIIAPSTLEFIFIWSSFTLGQKPELDKHGGVETAVQQAVKVPLIIVQHFTHKTSLTSVHAGAKAHSAD